MKFSIILLAFVLTACSKGGAVPNTLMPLAEKLCASVDGKPEITGTRLWFPTFKSELYTVCTKDGMKEKIEISVKIK